MDTIIQKTQFTISTRTCEYVLSLSLFISLVLVHTIFFPPLFANDLVANNTTTIPALKQMTNTIKEEFNPQIKKEKFDNRISAKYKGLAVNNISDGVKHIRMTKYYNAKPVILLK